MILFKKGNYVSLRNYCATIDFKNRAYLEFPYICNLLCKNNYCSNTFEWNIDTKKNGIPDYVLKYYKGGDHVIGGSRKSRRETADRGYAVLLLDDSLKRFEVTRSEAEELLNFIAQNVPSTFETLPDEVLSKFCHKLEDEAEYCPKFLFLFATEKIVEWGGYRDYWFPSKYIVTDANMNPIDVDKMVKVLKTILVDK